MLRAPPSELFRTNAIQPKSSGPKESKKIGANNAIGYPNIDGNFSISSFDIWLRESVETKTLGITLVSNQYNKAVPRKPVPQPLVTSMNNKNVDRNDDFLSRLARSKNAPPLLIEPPLLLNIL